MRRKHLFSSSFLKFFILSLLIGLNGCATLFSGTHQSLQLRALDTEQNPLPQTRCKVLDGNGDMSFIDFGGKDTLYISARRGYNDLSLICTADGYTQFNTGKLGAKFNPVTLFNIALLPLLVLPAPIGFTIDILTGAVMKYPSDYNIIMHKLNRPAPAQQASADSGSRN